MTLRGSHEIARWQEGLFPRSIMTGKTSGMVWHGCFLSSYMYIYIYIEQPVLILHPQSIRPAQHTSHFIFWIFFSFDHSDVT